MEIDIQKRGLNPRKYLNEGHQYAFDEQSEGSYHPSIPYNSAKQAEYIKGSAHHSTWGSYRWKCLWVMLLGTIIVVLLWNGIPFQQQIHQTTPQTSEILIKEEAKEVLIEDTIQKDPSQEFEVDRPEEEMIKNEHSRGDPEVQKAFDKESKAEVSTEQEAVMQEQQLVNQLLPTEPVVPEILTVHLVAHSHDDVGWLKTVDQYFYGGNNQVQLAGVQYTIDTVVTELTEHPNYKFIIVQMAFLYRWWRQASKVEKRRMKALVANGQLQFVNAGWCASDEATIYYQDFIQNMIIGLRWLKQTFGYVPKTAWHVDPFGHQATTASLFAQMGFQSVFFSRIDYQDKAQRLRNKAMEMIWRPAQLSGSKEQLFTQIIYHHYSPPPSFYYQKGLGPPEITPIKDDPTLQDYNIDKRSQDFVIFFKEQAKHYRTKNIMHTIGEDFTYMMARMQFKNFQKLVNYINQRPQFQIFFKFSTPDDYLQAIFLEQQEYPLKTDDFMPYGDNEHSYWTGYFTSRPAFKGFVRDFSRYLQTAKKHLAELKIRRDSVYISDHSGKVEHAIFQMEMALGIFQHHDAITGTAKQRVNDDYVHTGLKAISVFNEMYSQVMREEIKKQTEEDIRDLYFNIFWNETGEVTGLSKSLGAGQTVLVNLYNPGSEGTYPIRLKVPPKSLEVKFQDNSRVVGDVVCANLKSSADCQLWVNIHIRQSSNAYLKLSTSEEGSAKLSPLIKISPKDESKSFELGDDLVTFYPIKRSFTLKFNQRTENVQLFYNFYEGWDSDGQKSGAYMFRPKSDTPKTYSQILQVYYAEGLNNVVFLLEGENTLTRVYFSKTTDYVEKYGFMVESQLDSIPIEDGVGKQVTLNIKTDVKNKLTFFTDSMGLEEQERKINYRPTWKLSLVEPTGGNYYPINSIIRIQDTEQANRSITVLTDRSQGGSVLREGEIQIMIHRRLLVDDTRGVDQALNETESNGMGLRQTIRHYVVFSDQYRQIQKWNDQRILPTFGQSEKPTFSRVRIEKPLIEVPRFVKLNLRPYEDGTYFMRLHNMDPSNSAKVVLDSEWKLQENTLAFNQLVEKGTSKKRHWRGEGQDNRTDERSTDAFSKLQANSRSIALKPFEMRTFKGWRV